MRAERHPRPAADRSSKCCAAAPQASRGYGSLGRSRKIFSYSLSPSPQNARLILIASCSIEGRFIEALLKWDQSESLAGAWERSEPSDAIGAADVPRKHVTREALGIRPARNGALPLKLAGRGQASGAKSPCGQVPGSTDQGLKTPGRSAGRRCRGLYFSAIRETSCGRYTTRCVFRRSVSPHVEGRKLKAKLARRRGNEAAWLFEI